ncbi:MAG: hydroxyethylthiazole kinase [Micropruina sp.]
MSIPAEAITAETCAALLDAVRAATPLVQCLTNHVVSGFTANVLLALGAAPAMVDIPDEAGAFAPVASGVLINLGTLGGRQPEAMREAAAAAHAAGTPWLLDPVAVGALPVRTPLAAELLGAHPTLIRGNASEIAALAGAGQAGRGVDATLSVDAASAPARELAGRAQTVVAVSGPVDLITDGSAVLRVGNGHELLTRVTGAGCALGAVMVAFAAVADDPLTAAVAAHCAYGVAAEDAAAGAAGPGSFAVALLDALAALTPDALVGRVRLEVAR